ncbi:MAG: D-2-hydroxyacid dehydrogenase [Acidimicrobiia bacterium]|jgi:phosphoglycerate dehydrogenase-like enzyme
MGADGPIVVWVAWPVALQADVLARVAAVDPRIEVVACGYEEAGILRNARSRHEVDAGARADAVGAVTDAHRDAMARAEVVFGFDVPFDLADHAPHLRWVQGIGSGYEHIWGAGLDRDGITVTNAVGVSAAPMAEFVIGRVLALYKRFPEIDARAGRHEWKPAYGRMLAGSTVGIIGLGAIGQAVADRASALGMRVVASRRSYRSGMTAPNVDTLLGPDDLPALLGESDVVVLCAPSTPQTRDLIGADALAAMRPGTIFVNVGRGTMVDEPVLIDALERGHLAAAVLDVTSEEPLPPEHPLWDAPNVYISAHCSATSDGYVDRVGAVFLDNLDRYVAGEPLRNVVDAAAV